LASAEDALDACLWMTSFMRYADSWILRNDVRPSFRATLRPRERGCARELL
jgi:hypothetical protein